jgi:hypothetical protein
MKMKFYSLIIFFLVILIVNAYGQSVEIAPGKTVFKEAMERELAKSFRDRYLYQHADAFERIIQLRALKSLGYDLTRSKEDFSTPQDLIETFDTVADAGKNAADQNETTTAINRKNPKIIIAGANDSRMYNSGMPSYTSSDEGKSWRTYYVPTPKNSDFPIPLGDPSMVADDSGYFYYVYLSGSTVSSSDNLMVATSKDGKVWKNGQFIVSSGNTGGFEDKEHITIDRSTTSPYYGRVYVVWMHFEDPSSGEVGGARIAWSDDRGLSWSDVVNITDNGLIEFAEVKTGKNGEVVVTFTIPDGAGAGSHAIYVSKNGGKNFTGSSFADYTDYPVISDVQRSGLKGDYGFRCLPYIAQDIDLKTNQIHLVYGSYEGGDAIGFAAVLYYVSSMDFGKTWSKPKAVGIADPSHAGLTVDRFCPWVSVNQKTGDAYAVYYSSEDDREDNILVSAYRTKLSGGMTEYQHFIGDRSFDPTEVAAVSGQAPFLGDYIGSDCYDTVYAAAWTENRLNYNDGDVYVFTSYPKHATGPAKGVEQPLVLNSKNLWLSAPNPNPVSGGFMNFSYYLPRDADLEISLSNSAGITIKTYLSERVETGTYTKEYSVRDIPSGVYTLHLSTSFGSVERKVIIVK